MKPMFIERRRPASLLLLLVWTAACSSSERPNVILISLDTVRADHLSVYGYERETTPNLGSLAREGVVFEQTFTQAPWTVSSHMSVFVSLYPDVHDVSHMRPQSETVKTLPGILQAAGYSTGGFVAPVLEHYGFAKGFDHYFATRRARPADVMVAHAMRWLAQDPEEPVLQEQPFFLFLHLFDAHLRYEPPWPFDTAYCSSYSPDIQEISQSHPHSQDKNLTPEELAQVVALYDGEIAFADYALGRLFTHLKKLGLYDSSLIVVMGDHGEGFLEHGLMNHGNSVYDELLRVPLIFRFPGGRFGGKRVQEPVQLIDITPTILEVTGAGELDLQQGESLLRYLEDDAEPGRRVYAAEGYAQCIRTADWKLIQNPDARFTKIPRSLKVEYELYNLGADRSEQVNLAEERTETVEVMAAELERLRKGNVELRATLLEMTQASPLELTEEQKEILRTLGYIQ